MLKQKQFLMLAIFWGGLGAIGGLAGAPAGAVPVTIRGVRGDSSTVDLHMFDGELFLSEGREAEALKQFQIASDLDPDRARPHWLLAQTLMGVILQGRAAEPGIMGRDAVNHWLWLLAHQEESREPEERLVQLARFYDNRAGSLLGSKAAKRAWAKAQDAFRDENWASAVDAYRRVLKIEPKAMGVTSRLGRALLNQGDFTAAEAEYRRALTTNPFDAPAVAGLGQALEGQGKNQEALEQYKRAIHSQFREETTAEAILRLMNQDPPESLPPEDAYVLGEALLMTRRLEEALPYLESAAQRDPSPKYKRSYALSLYFGGRYKEAIEAFLVAYEDLPDLETTYYLGACYLEIGNEERALMYLHEVLSRDPGNSNALRLVGLNLAKKSGNEREAVETLKRAVEAGASIPDLACILGMLESRLGNQQEARDQFNACLTTNPDYPPAHLTLGLLADEHGDYGQTILHLEQYLNSSPPDAAILMRLGVAYLRLDRPEEGFSTLRRLVALNPNLTTSQDDPPNDQALLELASFFLSSVNRYDDAIWVGEQLLQVDPENAVYNNNLAMVYADADRENQRAYDLAVKANLLDPDNPGHMDTLAWTLVRLGKDDEAETLLLKSIDLAHESKIENLSEIYYHLGFLYHQTGARNKSREWLTKARQGSPTPLLRDAIDSLLYP